MILVGRYPRDGARESFRMECTCCGAEVIFGIADSAVFTHVTGLEDAMERERYHTKQMMPHTSGCRHV